VAIPPAKATLAVSLGWLRGTGVPVGLVDMGQFVVDDVTWDGPPDRITVRAHSADFKDSFRTRKTRSWVNQSLGTIANQIASEQGLTPRIHPDLTGIIIPAAEQQNQSDMEFLRDLGRRHDAVATAKAGALILAPMDAATTATGATLPTISITRSTVERYSYSRSAREGTYQGAEANYYDQDEAARAIHQEGAEPRRRLKRVYATQPDAQAAATAETRRQQRAEAKFDLTLSRGNPAIAPGQSATVQGFKTEIDATTWRTATVDHAMGPDGLSTSLTLEVAGT
jgi:phage protein D